MQIRSFCLGAYLPRDRVCRSSETRQMAMKLFTLYGASGNTLMTEMVIPIAAANRSVARTSAVTPCPWSWISHFGNAEKGWTKQVSKQGKLGLY